MASAEELSDCESEGGEMTGPYICQWGQPHPLDVEE